MATPLTDGERVRLAAEVVEEAIAALQPQELVGHDALEGRAEQRALSRTFRNAGNEQVDVLDRPIQQLETLQNLENEENNDKFVSALSRRLDLIVPLQTEHTISTDHATVMELT